MKIILKRQTIINLVCIYWIIVTIYAEIFLFGPGFVISLVLLNSACIIMVILRYFIKSNSYLTFLSGAMVAYSIGFLCFSLFVFVFFNWTALISFPLAVLNFITSIQVNKISRRYSTLH